MDSLSSTAHRFAAPSGRPKRAAPRFVNSLRAFDSHRADNKKGHPDGAAFFCWWRWRESNSRPQALRYEVYMLIPSLISLQATRRAGKTHSQFSKDLTVRALNMPLPRSCVGDSCDPDAQARSGQKAFTGF